MRIPTSPLGRHVQALTAVVPAVVAILGFQAAADWQSLLFASGGPVLVHNLCQLVLMPYAALFLLILGKAAPVAGRWEPLRGLGRGDVLAVELFVGVAVLIVAGFLLGLLGLLYPPLTGAVFVGTIYAFVYRRPEGPAEAADAVVGWLSARETAAASPSERMVRILIVILRVGVVGLLLQQVLRWAFYIDLSNGDIYQLYVSYMAEVRERHGTQIDPLLPRFVDFLVSRGNGAHLFLTNFTGPLFLQALGIIFLFLEFLIVRRLCVLMLPSDDRTSVRWRRVRWILPDVVLAALLQGNLGREVYQVTKFHTQTGALFLFALWAVTLLFELEEPSRKTLERRLAIVFFAIPVSLIAYQLPVTIILAVAALRAVVEKRRELQASFARFFAVGAAACCFSAAVDWAYVGIPGIAPFNIFRRLIWPAVFQRWGGEDIFIYTDFAQAARVAPTLNLRQVFLNCLPSFKFSLLTQGLLLSFVALMILLMVVAPAVTRSVLPRNRRLIAGALLFALLGPLAMKYLRFAVDNGGLTYIWTVFALIVLGGLAARAPLSDFPAAIYGLWAYVFIMMAVVQFTWSPSLGRLSMHLTFVERATKWGLVIYVVHLYSRLEKPWRPPFWAAMAFLALLGAPRSRHAEPADEGAADAPRDGRDLQLEYFLGRLSMVDLSTAKEPSVAPRMELCRRIAGDLPDDGSSALHLNYYTGMGSCVYSPDLPRGKIQHQYESVFARNFAPLALGDAEQARALYQKLKIDYFFLMKSPDEFWGASFGELFSAGHLAEYFDVWREDPDYLILTWRGRGKSPVTRELASAIDAWRYPPDAPNPNPNSPIPPPRAFRNYVEWARANGRPVSAALLARRSTP